MNNGNCWVTAQTFDQKKNSANISIFNKHVESIKINHRILFDSVCQYGSSKIEYSNLNHYCTNTRADVNIHGTWNKDSTAMIGYYQNFQLMLNKIEFPWS